LFKYLIFNQAKRNFYILLKNLKAFSNCTMKHRCKKLFSDWIRYFDRAQNYARFIQCVFSLSDVSIQDAAHPNPRISFFSIKEQIATNKMLSLQKHATIRRKEIYFCN